MYNKYSEKIYKDFSSKVNWAKTETILIKTNFVSDLEYPFSTSWEFFQMFVSTLRKKYDGELIIIEPEFAGLQWLDVVNDKVDLLKKHDIRMIKAQNEKRVAVKTKGGDIYVPLSWANADVRISMANLNIHRHHSIRRLLAGYYNIAWLFTRTRKDFSFLRKKHYASYMELDFKAFMRESIAMNRKYHTYSIVDAIQVGYSDEHSLKIKTKEYGKIFATDNLEEEARDIVEKLSIKNVIYE